VAAPLKKLQKSLQTYLEGNGTDAQNSVVLANSALAIHTIRQNEHIEDSVEEAKSSYSEEKLYKL
jgi:anthranilate phosphoribosyltransferase